SQVADEPPRSPWEKLLTLSPVVLTVLATLLAGLSSSEMTQAQYHRSLAAQNQSKAGDQWAFFQAKRIRGTSLETTVDLLGSLSERGTAGSAALQAALDRLPADFRRTGEGVARLLQSLEAAKTELGSAREPLRRAAERLQQTARELAKKAETAK